MIESVIVNEWKAEAALKSKIEDVLAILEERFGPVATEAKSKIEATTSIDVLRRWVPLAAKVATLHEFIQAAGL